MSDKYKWIVTLSDTQIKPGFFVYTESIFPNIDEDSPNQSSTILSILLPESERIERIQFLKSRGFQDEKEKEEKEATT